MIKRSSPHLQENVTFEEKLDMKTIFIFYKSLCSLRALDRTNGRMEFLTGLTDDDYIRQKSEQSYRLSLVSLFVVNFHKDFPEKWIPGILKKAPGRIGRIISYPVLSFCLRFKEV